MLTSPNLLLGKGLVALGVGLISIIWPGITLIAIVAMFAVFAFFSAAADAMRALTSDAFGPVIGWLLLSSLSVAAGIIALAWPGITVYALAVWIGLWALITGLVDISLSFGYGETPGERAVLALTGVVAMLFAFALFMHPNSGAVALATVFGVFTMFFGISAITGSFQLRHLISLKAGDRG